MSNKEDILKKYRSNIHESFEMPDLSDITPITYQEPLSQFIEMSKTVGGNIIDVKENQDINALVKDL